MSETGYNEEDALRLKWALICSIPDQNKIEDLKSFGSWFVKEVSKRASSLGLYFSFEDAPLSTQHVQPGDMDCCAKAYENIHTMTPSVLFVLHILPGQGADEHNWMKSLASRYGVIRQGVLMENALNRFSSMDHDSVFQNISQWISRSFSKLINWKDNDRSFDIRVGPGPNSASRFTYDAQMVQSAVNHVIHTGQVSGVNVDDVSVRVSGFPSWLNEFGVAQLFPELAITGVTRSAPQNAIVTFLNKFHALQAASLFDGRQIDRGFKLSVIPVSADVRSHLSATKIDSSVKVA